MHVVADTVTIRSHLPPYFDLCCNLKDSRKSRSYTKVLKQFAPMGFSDASRHHLSAYSTLSTVYEKMHVTPLNYQFVSLLAKIHFCQVLFLFFLLFFLVFLVFLFGL